MDIFIFDKDLNLIGNIDSFASFDYNRKFQKTGNFEFYVNANLDNVDILKEDNIIYKNDGFNEEAGLIEQIKKEVKDNYEVFRVSGSLTSKLIARRIFLKQILFNGKLEDLIYKMLDENLISPEDTKRIIPNFKRAELKGLTETIHYEKSYGNILDEIEKVLEATEVGFRTVFNPELKIFTFELYKGLDRTVNQSDRAPCIFSNEFENIFNENYIFDKRDFKNTALIAGQGEGINRKKTIINDTNEGLNRYELYVDARDIADTIQNGNSDGTEETETPIPESEYLKLLEDRGIKKLSEHTVLENFECDVNTRGNNKYKIDYDLGDKITVFSNRWGIQLDALITEITEIYEDNNLEIKLGLGKPKMTISDEIKRLRKE